MEFHKLLSLFTLFATVVTPKGTTKRHLQYLIYNYKCFIYIKSITQYIILGYTLYLKLLYSLNIINLHI